MTSFTDEGTATFFFYFYTKIFRGCVCTFYYLHLILFVDSRAHGMCEDAIMRRLGEF